MTLQPMVCAICKAYAPDPQPISSTDELLVSSSMPGICVGLLGGDPAGLAEIYSVGLDSYLPVDIGIVVPVLAVIEFDFVGHIVLRIIGPRELLGQRLDRIQVQGQVE